MIRYEVKGLNEDHGVIRTDEPEIDTSHMRATAQRFAHAYLAKWTECRYIRVYYNGERVAVADRQLYRPGRK